MSGVKRSGNFPKRVASRSRFQDDNQQNSVEHSWLSTNVNSFPFLLRLRATASQTAFQAQSANIRFGGKMIQPSSSSPTAVEFTGGDTERRERANKSRPVIVVRNLTWGLRPPPVVEQTLKEPVKTLMIRQVNEVSIRSLFGVL